MLGSPEYTEAMSHFSAVNVQQSTCVVEPATQGHIGTIVRFSSVYRSYKTTEIAFRQLRTLSATKTPFAVSSCGISKQTIASEFNTQGLYSTG